MVRSLIPAVAFAAVLGSGCATPFSYSGPSFAGRWVASDPELGTLTLDAETTTTGAVKCVLTDLHGEEYAFEGYPSSGEDGVGVLEVELAVGHTGLKVLFNELPDPFEIRGSMNYSGGRSQASFTRMRRGALDLVLAEFYRASRPDDTLRTINLYPVDPVEAEDEATSRRD